MFEVLDSFARLAKRKSVSDAQLWRNQLIHSLPIRIEVPDLDGTFDAAHLKAQYRISYADAFAASLALHYDAPLMAGDPELHSVPNLRLNWIRQPQS
jgi:predicted nucleic acid-binding protein